MDAEGLGHRLLLTPSADPRRTPEKQTVGTVTASQKMLSLQALSRFLNAGPANGGCLGRGEAPGCLRQSVPQNGRVHLHIIDTNLAKIITKQFLGTFSFVIIFVFITKIIPPEDFLCNVAATGVSFLGRNKPRNLVCKVILL